MRAIITIDPGANGGVCVKTDIDLRCFKIPESLVLKAALLADLRRQLTGEPKVIIEDVGFHVKGSHAQGSVKLARHVGQLEGIITVLGFDREYVKPTDWMKRFPDRPKNLNKAERAKVKSEFPSFTVDKLKKEVAKRNAKRKTERKAYIKAKVQAAFPDVQLYLNPDKKPKHVVTNWAADALGILLWAQNV